MFKKLLDELLEAATQDEITAILYRNGKTDSKGDGVDLAFQHEKLSWQDHERLFKLAGRLEACLP